jgi:hypothetical protein
MLHLTVLHLAAAKLGEAVRKRDVTPEAGILAGMFLALALYSIDPGGSPPPAAAPANASGPRPKPPPLRLVQDAPWWTNDEPRTLALVH